MGIETHQKSIARLGKGDAMLIKIKFDTRKPLVFICIIIYRFDLEIKCDTSMPGVWHVGNRMSA